MKGNAVDTLIDSQTFALNFAEFAARILEPMWDRAKRDVSPIDNHPLHIRMSVCALDQLDMDLMKVDNE
jgi:hypothetical protein